MINPLLNKFAPYLAILALIVFVFSYIKYVEAVKESLKIELENKKEELEQKEDEVIKVGFEEKWEATTVPVITEHETVITERNDTETNDTIYTIQFIKAIK